MFHNREVVDVIIENQTLDDMTYSGETLSLLIKRMPGIFHNDSSVPISHVINFILC